MNYIFHVILDSFPVLLGIILMKVLCDITQVIWLGICRRLRRHHSGHHADTTADIKSDRKTDTIADIRRDIFADITENFFADIKGDSKGGIMRTSLRTPGRHHADQPVLQDG
ncbi:hypothetical protein [Qiania dongpingensis]|uniref:Uncharacterized protein n=1 Tax=Qiania dongpingensis TaxID=2763669 RepID=A0A7G9G6C4_9FIRM|nr:hypothetical protein [Qiania dongpingensis]QNM06356.1 hypothetical protein H9Q78_04255 [Qiania dongpingensis]